MELLQLRYFKDAAELENFSMVAKKNMVPQPSISKTIGKSEDELGVLLFDRQGKRIVLNDNGKFFYEKVSTALIILTVALSILKPLYTKILKFILRREVVLFLFLPLIFYIPQWIFLFLLLISCH